MADKISIIKCSMWKNVWVAVEGYDEEGSKGDCQKSGAIMEKLGDVAR